MKPKEYIRKYNLETTENFNHNEFIADLTADFLAVIEIRQNSNNFNYENFKNCIKDVRQKWDSISNKAKGTGLPEKLWNYFYATIVIKLRDELFGEYLKKKQTAYEEKKKERASYQQWEDHFFGGNNFFGSFFGMFANLLHDLAVPHEAFKTLELTIDATIDDVKSKYRELSIKHHPDKGGKAEDFMKITEAKNKCIMYLESHERMTA
ncbi:MAG: DnaJ domain-containing protein [Nitrosarchaeum sp.]|nr:DnaJ domain-containing protein [Nitrosarchaeum sp.]